MKLHRAKFSHLENLIAEWSQYVERMESEIAGFALPEV